MASTGRIYCKGDGTNPCTTGDNNAMFQVTITGDTTWDTAVAAGDAHLEANHTHQITTDTVWTA